MDNRELWPYLLTNLRSIQRIIIHFKVENEKNDTESQRKIIIKGLGDNVCLFTSLMIVVIRGKEVSQSHFLGCTPDKYHNVFKAPTLLININTNQSEEKLSENFQEASQKIKRFFSSKIDGEVLLRSCKELYESNLIYLEHFVKSLQAELAVWKENNLSENGIDAIIFLPFFCFINPKINRLLIVNILPEYFDFGIFEPTEKYLAAAVDEELFADLEEKMRNKDDKS